MKRHLYKISNWDTGNSRSYTVMKYAWISSDGGPISIVTFRSAARWVCDRRGPGVKLLFRPTFTPAAAGVTFDWTATLNWFRLKPLPPRRRPPYPRLPPPRVSFPSIDAVRHPLPAFSSFTRFRPSSASDSSSFHFRSSFLFHTPLPFPPWFAVSIFFLNLIASLQTLRQMYFPLRYFFIVRLRTFEKLIAGRFDRKCAKGERVMCADEWNESWRVSILCKKRFTCWTICWR